MVCVWDWCVWMLLGADVSGFVGGVMNLVFMGLATLLMVVSYHNLEHMLTKPWVMVCCVVQHSLPLVLFKENIMASDRLYRR